MFNDNRLRRVMQRLTLIIILVVSATLADELPKPVRPEPIHRMVGRVVGMRLSRQHYKRTPLNDDVSRQLYLEYFDALDYNRYFFLAEDIESFKPYQTNLDDLLLQGKPDFAYEVYDLFLTRVRERMAYVRERVEKPFDFTRKEVIRFDRSEEPWAPNKTQLDELWRLRLKNNLLTYSLMEATPADDKDKTDDAVETAKPRKTPKERALSYYERYLHLMEEKDAMEILEIYLGALARIYDPHSAYMAPSTEEDFDIQMKLSLQGIGALLSSDEGYTKIVEVIPGGPAEMDGRLKPGDRIIEVAQGNEEPVDIIDMPLRKVVRLIRGSKGSRVVLTVIQAAKGLGSIPVKIDIVRDNVKLTEQEAKSSETYLDESGRVVPEPEEAVGGLKKILTITLPSFYLDFESRQKRQKDYKSASRDVRRLIEEADPATLDGMILDLRGNGGGSLDDAVEIAGMFFEEGPVVQARYSDGRITVLEDEDRDTLYAGPLVVLIDRLSASASEIVAAALQDYGRAIILGDQTTHGKGTIQTLYDLKREFQHSPLLRQYEPGSLKFTVGKFYRINGGATQLRGVRPDISFPAFADHMELGEAELPHAMPWNAIKPLRYTPFKELNQKMDAIRGRSKQRLALNTSYQEYLNDIQMYGERRARKTLSLNREERLREQKKDEEFSKRIEALHLRTSRQTEDTETDENQNENKKPEVDFVAEEALHILDDLGRLKKGRALADITIPTQRH